MRIVDYIDVRMLQYSTKFPLCKLIWYCQVTISIMNFIISVDIFKVMENRPAELPLLILTYQC